MGLGDAKLRRYVGLGETCLQTHFPDQFDENCVLRTIDGLWHGRVYGKSGFQSYIALPYIGTYDTLLTLPRRRERMDVLTPGPLRPCESRLQCGHRGTELFRRPLWAALHRCWTHASLATTGWPLVQVATANAAPILAPRTASLRAKTPTITPTSPNPHLQFTPSFAPAATPCELHPTSAHPPHSTSHHRECCAPTRLTLCIPARMVHA